MKILSISTRFRVAILAAILGTSSTAHALDSVTVTASAVSPDCLEYRVSGVCYWH